MKTETYNIELLRYNDFVITLIFDYDISSLNYYSEIRNIKNELAATFTIVKDATSKTIILMLDKDIITALTDDVYKYDIKQVSDIEIVIVKGKVVVTSGVTQ
jgi:hypothetical protein